MNNVLAVGILVVLLLAAWYADRVKGRASASLAERPRLDRWS